MAEEQEQEGTMSGLKKTLIGTLGTIVTAAGVYATTLLGGGDKAEPAPVQAAPVINITNSNQQSQQAAGGGKTVIIKEKSNESVKPAAPVKKKEADEFKEKPAQW
jgi:flagellar basal body-associated protein FliL